MDRNAPLNNEFGVVRDNEVTENDNPFNFDHDLNEEDEFDENFNNENEIQDMEGYSTDSSSFSKDDNLYDENTE